MPSAIAVLLALALASPLAAQERVTTASGRVVLLYPDGTWKYAPTATAPPSGKGHNRPAEATARVDFARGRGSLFYDPTKWQETKAKEPGRINLVHTEGDAYAIIIAERLQMSIDALRDLALNNAKAAAPDAQIVSQETRRVNGHDVMALQITGSMQGIGFVYFGYYYVGSEGTFQLLTYTAKNLFDEYKPQFERLLDGFTLNP
jgi:hypothetical protein